MSFILWFLAGFIVGIITIILLLNKKFGWVMGEYLK